MANSPKVVKLIWDAQYWRDRAEEARAMRDNLSKADCKRLMGDIADAYDWLADLTRDFKTAAGPQKPPSADGEPHRR
jgi:hypothetical protein